VEATRQRQEEVAKAEPQAAPPEEGEKK